MYSTKYILVSMLAMSSLFSSAPNKKLKKRFLNAQDRANRAFFMYMHQRNPSNLAKLKEATKKGKRIGKAINRQIESERERGLMHKMVQVMLLLSVHNNLPLRRATKADFGLKPKNKKKKDWLQTNNQKTQNKCNQRKRQLIQQPRKQY